MRGITRNWLQNPTAGPMGRLEIHNIMNKTLSYGGRRLDNLDIIAEIFMTKPVRVLLDNLEDLVEVNLHAHDEEREADTDTEHDVGKDVLLNLNMVKMMMMMMI